MPFIAKTLQGRLRSSVYPGLIAAFSSGAGGGGGGGVGYPDWTTDSNVKHIGNFQDASGTGDNWVNSVEGAGAFADQGNATTNTFHSPYTFGASVDIDGNDYLKTLSASAQLVGDFSMGIFFRADNLSTTRECLFGAWPSAGNNKDHLFDYDSSSNLLRFKISTDGTDTDGVTSFEATHDVGDLTESEWHFVTVARRSDQLYFQVDDGIPFEPETDAISGNAYSSSGLSDHWSIAGRDGGTEIMDGYVAGAIQIVGESIFHEDFLVPIAPWRSLRNQQDTRVGALSRFAFTRAPQYSVRVSALSRFAFTRSPQHSVRVSALSRFVFTREAFDYQSPVLHYDFSDPANYTLSGSDVTGATDLGSLGYDLTSAATRYPTIGTINGVDAAVFDGANDLLETASNVTLTAFTTNDQPFTFAAVIQNDDGANGAGQTFFALNRSGGSTAYYSFQKSGGDLWITNKRDSSATSAAVGTETVDTAAHVLIATSTGTAASVYVDGVLVDDAVAQDVSGMLGINRVVLGAYHQGSSYFNFWDGLIGEVAIYDKELTSDEVVSLHSRLKSKWGL